MKKQKNNSFIILAVILFVVVATLVGLLFVRRNVEDAGNTNPTTAIEEISIKTTYCELFYPKEWEDYLVTKQQDNRVSFYAKIAEHEQIQLFDIVFNNSAGDYVGKINCSDGTNADVCLLMCSVNFDETWDEKERTIVHQMQSGARYAIGRLPLAHEVAGEKITIETSYTCLYYPIKWKEHLYTEQQGQMVRFYADIGEHERQHLFDVIFDSAEGDYIGVIICSDGREAVVSVRQSAFSGDVTWTQEEMAILKEMLGGLRTVVSCLPIKDSNMR